MPQAGEHKNVINQGRDINGLTMVHCFDCKSTTRDADEERAMRKMAVDRCVPNCENCRRLRGSYDGAPAVPEGGSCNDSFHTCPRCGKRWWQFNTHFHLWGQA
jgi:hypothetical protein